MKFSAICFALLPAALALPVAVPGKSSNSIFIIDMESNIFLADAIAKIATREPQVHTDSLFAVSYKKDLVSDPQKREAVMPLFAVKYATDITSDPEKRAQPQNLFPTRYRKDLFRDPQKREDVESRPLFPVKYAKDVSPSTKQ
jgi:hypothetical protein